MKPGYYLFAVIGLLIASPVFPQKQISTIAFTDNQLQDKNGLTPSKWNVLSGKCIIEKFGADNVISLPGDETRIRPKADIKNLLSNKFEASFEFFFDNGQRYYCRISPYPVIEIKRQEISCGDYVSELPASTSPAAYLWQKVMVKYEKNTMMLFVNGKLELTINDLADVPEEVRDDLTIHLVDAVDEGLKYALHGEIEEIAAEIDIAGVGDVDLVVIAPDDPGAMLRHTASCRDRGVAFAADPSQQLTFMDGDTIRQLVDGATYLFTNEYEAALIFEKTGWTAEQVLDLVGTRITTHGAKGISIFRKGEPVIEVAPAPAREVAEPTGVGDAFRAGFLCATGWGLPLERAAQVGAMLATHVVETVGTQEYSFTPDGFLARFTEAYGEAAAAEVAPHLR